MRNHRIDSAERCGASGMRQAAPANSLVAGQRWQPGAWSLEPEAWSLEPGAWSLKPEA